MMGFRGEARLLNHENTKEHEGTKKKTKPGKEPIYNRDVCFFVLFQFFRLVSPTMTRLDTLKLLHDDFRLVIVRS